MKVTSVLLISEYSDTEESIEFSFRDSRRLQPYNVKAIVGLDADEIIPKFYLGSNNSKFYSLALAKREVVVRVELNPSFDDGETHSDLRDALYKKIASWRTGLIGLAFKNGADIVAFVQGHVVKFEASHMTQNPEVQITISCKEPLLRAPERTIVDVSAFNEALIVLTDDESTAPHGMQFQVDVLATRSQFKLTDPTNLSWSLTVVPFGGFLNGDSIFFSSELDNKYFYMTRASVVYHLASVISPGSVWPVMFPGDNSFALENPTSFNWAAISYYHTYWGV